MNARGLGFLLSGVLAFQLVPRAALADALADSEALAWLQKIAAAARELSYSGTFVYQHGEQVETSRITHYVDRAGEIEKLETLDGPKREIVRNQNEIITFYAESKSVKRERRAARRSFPALLPDALSSITEFYQLRKGGQERIAGLDAQALVLEPRDEFRYGHKLWADVSSGLLLKAKMINERHQMVEQFHFTQVTIGPVPKEAVRPSFVIPPIPARAPQADVASPAETGWVVRNSPAGFRKILEMSRMRRDGQGQVAHLVFSDGLAAVSVFIEPLPASRKVPDGLMHQGALHIYSRSLPDQLVTVLGETPAATVVQMGNSVAPKGK
jgi:sigma-E factor negative regulatory protein RseB